MDQFGISEAVRGATEVYFLCSRGTGRTASLVENVRDGDRICFTNAAEAQRVKRLCAARGVDVQTIVASPRHLEELIHRGPSKGRMIFDHSWVEDYYRLAIERCAKDIAYFGHQLGGRGETCVETQIAIKEKHKWSKF